MKDEYEFVYIYMELCSSVTLQTYLIKIDTWKTRSIHLVLEIFNQVCYKLYIFVLYGKLFSFQNKQIRIFRNIFQEYFETIKL